MAKASKWVYDTVSREIYLQNITTWSTPHTALRMLVSNLCQEFAADNPRFDADKFVKACGF